MMPVSVPSSSRMCSAPRSAWATTRCAGTAQAAARHRQVGTVPAAAGRESVCNPARHSARRRTTAQGPGSTDARPGPRAGVPRVQRCRPCQHAPRDLRRRRRRCPGRGRARRSRGRGTPAHALERLASQVRASCSSCSGPGYAGGGRDAAHRLPRSRRTVAPVTAEADLEWAPPLLPGRARCQRPSGRRRAVINQERASRTTPRSSL
jgi:hypothetical protein